MLSTPELVYASAGLAKDILNDLIKVCDKEARTRLKATLGLSVVDQGALPVLNGR